MLILSEPTVTVCWKSLESERLPKSLSREEKEPPPEVDDAGVVAVCKAPLSFGSWPLNGETDSTTDPLD